MIAGDDQLAARAGEFRRQIERPLLAGSLDHAVAQRAASQLLHAADDRGVILHGNDLGCAELARHREREGAPGDCDHPRPGLACEPGQYRTQETDADDRHRLPRRQLAAPEDVHGAAERLTRERRSGERSRKPDKGGRVNKIVFGIAIV